MGLVIRTTALDDVAPLQAVLQGTALFPPEMLPDLIGAYFDGSAPDAIWLSCLQAGQVVGFCHAMPETLADGTWNMLAIAVLPAAQGGGCGGALVRHLEDMLRARAARVLIADTSGTNAFAQTRAFYRKNGYAEEARIRDFWAAGDDKVVFWKALQAG
jgi:ribosomal protein S18 acetylase RimI-like enzyme